MGASRPPLLNIRYVNSWEIVQLFLADTRDPGTKQPIEDSKAAITWVLLVILSSLEICIPLLTFMLTSHIMMTQSETRAIVEKITYLKM